MILVDTTVWIDYFRGTQNAETDYLDRETGRQLFGFTDLVLCEILQGVRDEAGFAQVLNELSSYDVFDTGGMPLAIEAARNYRQLRRQGHSVRKTIDCLLATFCIQNGHSLLHRDRDFDHFERHLGLSVVHP